MTMPHPCPHHCPKDGGGGLAAVLVVLAVIVIAAAAHPVVHAAEDVLEVAVIAVASVFSLAALGATAYVALRVHRSHARTRQAVVSHTLATSRGAQTLSGSRPAIEPHRVIDGVVIHDEIAEGR
jgi:hypothetical protein